MHASKPTLYLVHNSPFGAYSELHEAVFQKPQVLAILERLEHNELVHKFFIFLNVELQKFWVFSLDARQTWNLIFEHENFLFLILLRVISNSKR